MKKTIAIHIGGYVFNIDEDAYEILNKWLDSLSTQFVNDPDGKEILEDIELGAAEHLNRLINSETGAVTMDEVHEVIRIMGDATDFEESDAENETEAEPKSE